MKINTHNYSASCSSLLTSLYSLYFAYSVIACNTRGNATVNQGWWGEKNQVQSDMDCEHFPSTDTEYIFFLC